MKQAFIYSLRVWLTAALVCPLIITVSNFIWLRSFLASARIDHSQIVIQYRRFLLEQSGMVLADLILLIPLGLGLYYNIILLYKRQVSFYWYKWFLSIVGFVLGLLPNAIRIIFILILKTTDTDLQRLEIRALVVNSSLYICVTVASIWLYKLNPVSMKASEIVNLE